MYTLIVARKKGEAPSSDYRFEDIETFFKVADNLTEPFMRRYKVSIKTDDISAMQEFLKQEQKFAHLDVVIETTQDALDHLALYHPDLHIGQARSGFTVFKELVSEYRLLFAKGSMLLLYNSIEHEKDAMVQVLSKLKEEFKETVIDEKKLSSNVVIKRITYPRTSLLAYLRLERYRKSTLTKCLSDMGNDVTLGAFKKNVKAFLTEKAEYLRSGKAEWYVKNLNSQNIALMYRILCMENQGINDVALLMGFYEKGVSPRDIIWQPETYV